PRITVLLRKAYGGGYLAMSGAPMQPDALIALPTAKPALMGPDAAVNGIHYNRIQAIEDPEERAAFIAEKQAEYAAGIDVFKIANENAVEAVVPANELRDELTQRLALYRKRDRTAPARRNGVTPV
ncbi:MAG: acyl-CoA carboxylase subunit beta, partial [Rhodococcus sp. (in: high G+C Gram-positive bacteria)]